MTFVYHGVPEQMEGKALIPLNEMPASMVAIRDMHVKKYKNRQEIMQRRIPLLNCLWNDAVQFLPLHPGKVFELQVELGLIPAVPPYKFFEIDVTTLEPDKTVVYFKTAPGEENVTFKWLRDVDLTTIQEIPKATVNYYKSLIGASELPFNYQFIPHVLHKGNVDISKSRIISLA